ncbi:MAG: TIGR03936 family radical SAM-associated protein [Candidatus Promineifilaceae bacterium]
MQANYEQRLRLIFSKDGPARYIGHLDLARTLERVLNRAQIPISYTQGFNRRPRLSFAAPLPLGYSSSYELAEIWLTETTDPQEVSARMMRVMAPGISIQQAVETSLKAPSLQSRTRAAHYVAQPLDEIDAQELAQRVGRLLDQESILRVRQKGKRKDKPYDLRPLILELSVQRDEVADVALLMNLMLQSGKTGRPDEVLDALGFDPLAARVQRTLLILDDV